MNVAITYHEAQELISKQFNLKLGLSMVDGRTMSVEYNPGLLLPTVRVDIHIEAIQGNTLILTYKCIPAVALLVQGAVKLLGDKVPAEIMKIDTSTRSIQVPTAIGVKPNCLTINLVTGLACIPFPAGWTR